MKFPTGFNPQALTLYSQVATFNTPPDQETIDGPYENDVEDQNKDDSTPTARCRDFHEATSIARERKDTFNVLRSEKSKLDGIFEKAKKEGLHFKDHRVLSILRKPQVNFPGRIQKRGQHSHYAGKLRKLVNEQSELTNRVERTFKSQGLKKQMEQ